MLKVLNRNQFGVEIEFTGADLKEWYESVGRRHIFICHVITNVVQNAIHSHRTFYPNAEQVIGLLKEAVPIRFRATPKYAHARVVESFMLSKYLIRDGNYQTRKNLLAYVPDDFVFKLTMR